MTQLQNGPPPGVNTRRRNAKVAMTALPAAGRQGAIPPWPLGPDVVTRAKLRVAEDKVTELEEKRAEGGRIAESTLTRAKEKVAVLERVVEIQYDREVELWDELWTTPQAVQWERLRWTRTVAQYARWEVLGESGDMESSKEARQLADRLGLNPMAMLRLRWEIVDGPAARVVAPTADGTVPAPVTDITSRRSRLS